MSPIIKPSFEQIAPAFGSSLVAKKFERSNPNKEPFWHFHPEVELVYVKGGNGKRHVGNHISYYQHGDLLLIGANLPHFGFTDRLTGNESETIVQFKEDFLGAEFMALPEILPIKQLFENAKLGIVFTDAAKDHIGGKLERMVDQPPFQKLITMIEVLHELAQTEDYYFLNSETISVEAKATDVHRLNTVFNYVRKHFNHNITLDEIAEQASMTVPAFCRYFKKVANKTFTHFVNEHRIVHATKLLSEGNRNITDICYVCGFNNIAHFNRQFKLITGKSPSAYRKELKTVLK